MSAELETNSNSSQVLSFPHQSRQAFELQLKQLAAVEQKIISDLHLLSEDDIIQAREKAKNVAGTGWRIQCACDYELWRRADRLKGGRGRVAKGDGVGSVLVKQAHIIGVTPNTIFNNAKIYELIKDASETNIIDNVSLSNLDEKGFFIAALSAPDHVEALKIFIEKKKEEPKFRVSQAFRLLSQTGYTKKAAKAIVVNSSRQPGSELLIAHIRRTIIKIRKEIIPDCPDKVFAERMYGEAGLIGELNDHLGSIDSEDLSTALCNAWSLGNHTEDRLARATRLPLSEVSRIMEKLSHEERFIKVPGEGSQRWHKVGNPLPEELRRRG